MSWSISMMGNPEKVAAAVEAEGANLSGQSKAEYEAAAPHLAGLVRQVFDKTKGAAPMVKINASGHGSSTNGEMVSQTISVSIEGNIYTKLLV